ncbi:hypothetical protein DSL72_002143 [Monilinia vaccinii-corymbosi]|uniref:Uncharacterized protein n=1 Tax=Monilinia vaccinii-corymbosi TaxID=61207 RepID=A0A8A3PBS5_9HELO|nr:hypothetical protein DSL72_002143 [Monilinia vaccinii-corymbosi]
MVVSHAGSERSGSRMRILFSSREMVRSSPGYQAMIPLTFQSSRTTPAPAPLAFSSAHSSGIAKHRVPPALKPLTTMFAASTPSSAACEKTYRSASHASCGAGGDGVAPERVVGWVPEGEAAAVEIENAWEEEGVAAWWRGAEAARMVDVQGEGSGVGGEQRGGDEEGAGCGGVRGRMVDVVEDEGGESVGEEAEEFDEEDEEDAWKRHLMITRCSGVEMFKMRNV